MSADRPGVDGPGADGPGADGLGPEYAPPVARSVMLTRAPEPRVRRALATSRSAAWLLPGPWTVVVWEADSVVDRYGELVGAAVDLGTYGALQLERAGDVLSYEVRRWGRAVDGHDWAEAEDLVRLYWEPDPEGDTEPLPDDVAAGLVRRGDPARLAEVAGRPDLAEPLGALLDRRRVAAEDALAALTSLLDLPSEVAPLLHGIPPREVIGMERVEPRGVLGSVLGSMRGEFDVPDGGGWEQRAARWERERPPAYRAACAGLAGAYAVLAWRAARGPGGPRPVRAVVWALSAAGSAWSAGPPRGRWPFRR